MGESQVDTITQAPCADMLTRGYRWSAIKMGVIFNSILYRETIEGSSLTLYGEPVPWGDVAKNPDAHELILGKTRVTSTLRDSGESIKDFVLAELENYFKPDRAACDAELRGPCESSIKAVFMDVLTLTAKQDERSAARRTLRRLNKELDDEEN